MHLMILRAQVQLGEEARAMELVNHRDWELVLGRLVIEGAVVDAEAPRVVVDG
jgi:hypothetical protein